MKKRTKDHTADFRSLAKDARALVSATAEVAEDKVVHARERLSHALERGGEIYDDVRENVVNKAKEIDEYVRERPYRALAWSACAAALIGYLLGRRK